MNITGVNLGSRAGSVRVGRNGTCKVLSWSDTLISVELPPLPAGSYPMSVLVADGYADMR